MIVLRARFPIFLKQSTFKNYKVFFMPSPPSFIINICFIQMPWALLHCTLVGQNKVLFLLNVFVRF